MICLTGTSIWLFATKWISDNISELVSHEAFLNCMFIYLLIAAIFSATICFIYGPFNNPRHTSILKIVLYFSALVFFYNGVADKNVIFVCFIMLTWSFKPFFLICYKKGLKFIVLTRRRFFPKSRILLTENEYSDQAYHNTLRELNELRNYCKSDNSDSWELVTRLSDPTK